MVPLWFRQKELLKELTKDRREHHRNLANKNQTIRTFQPGDLVIGTETSELECDRGKNGEADSLEEAGKNSYWIQKPVPLSS